MQPLYGDELDAVVSWTSKRNLSELVGKPVRLRFVLQDADVFAIRTEKSNDGVQANFDKPTRVNK